MNEVNCVGLCRGHKGVGITNRRAPYSVNHSINYHLCLLTLKVHSIDGQLIYSKDNINEAVHVFDIKEAAAGVYVLEVEAEEGKMHYKLIKN